jgi:glycosyltransferase involved in cell wall biosynthesis
MNLSVAIITKNEERILEKTLKSVRAIAEEIVIVDSGSTDRTEEIAISFGAQFYKEDWKGYGPQKNSAIDKCKGPWILNIDADEVLSDELQKEIAEIKSSGEEGVIYCIHRRAVVFGKEIRHGEWRKTTPIERLFPKNSGRYNDKFVHENFISEIKRIPLHGFIYHHTYLTLTDYFQRFNRYSTEAALEYRKWGKKYHLWKLAFEPAFKFFREYLLKLGFLDGVEGLVLAAGGAMFVMTKYFKLRELEKKQSGPNKL